MTGALRFLVWFCLYVCGLGLGVLLYAALQPSLETAVLAVFAYTFANGATARRTT